MNKKEYLDKLLELCTGGQLDLFNRMYPTGVHRAQIKHAISQVETTLYDLNIISENYNNVVLEFKNFKAMHNDEQAKHLETINTIKKAIVRLEQEKDMLENPISIENYEVQNRLNKLDALEAGGVDNWEWYDESMSQFMKNL